MMAKDEQIKLVKVTHTQDDIGQYVEAEETRFVFCSVSSVSAEEFFQAGQSGMKAQYRMTMFSHDYEGEQIIEYNGERFSVYRTYKTKTDDIELYVESRVGTK